VGPGGAGTSEKAIALRLQRVTAWTRAPTGAGGRAAPPRSTPPPRDTSRWFRCARQKPPLRKVRKEDPCQRCRPSPVAAFPGAYGRTAQRGGAKYCRKARVLFTSGMRKCPIRPSHRGQRPIRARATPLAGSTAAGHRRSRHGTSHDVELHRGGWGLSRQSPRLSVSSFVGARHLCSGLIGDEAMTREGASTRGS